MMKKILSILLLMSSLSMYPVEIGKHDGGEYAFWLPGSKSGTIYIGPQNYVYRASICLPAPQVANFLFICLIVRMLSNTYRIDELRSSDGIMHCLLRHARFMCKWNELK